MRKIKETYVCERIQSGKGYFNEIFMSFIFHETFLQRKIPNTKYKNFHDMILLTCAYIVGTIQCKPLLTFKSNVQSVNFFNYTKAGLLFEKFFPSPKEKESSNYSHHDRLDVYSQYLKLNF